MGDDRQRNAPREGGDGEQGPPRGITSRWEVVAGVVSTLLVAAVAGYIAREALSAPRTPPRVEVTVDSIVRSGDGWLVRFAAENRGTETAAAVVIEGELARGDSTVQTSETTLDYLPARSRRRGGLYFGHDPRAHALELRAHGYQEP